MINAALNLVPMAVGQGRPQIIPAVIAPATPDNPLPTSFSDPIFVTSPTNTDSAWRVDDWPIEHGGTLPHAGAACALYYDSGGALRCVWWDGVYTAPSPGGTAGGVLSGTYPNPGFASGGDLATSGPPSIQKLQGTTIPLIGTAWTAPSLINSWANLGAPFETAGYLKDPVGFVHLKGVLQSGATNTVAFVLPAGFRPGAKTSHPGAGVSCSVNVDVSGNVTLNFASGTVGLSGITFLAEN